MNIVRNCNIVQTSVQTKCIMTHSELIFQLITLIGMYGSEKFSHRQLLFKFGLLGLTTSV